MTPQVPGKRILALALLLLSMNAAAQPATAQFAAAQLEVAETALQGARQARARADYDLAGRLAAMAQVDARLAWSMSDSLYLRRAAARVNAAAELLHSQLVLKRAKQALIQPR